MVAALGLETALQVDNYLVQFCIFILFGGSVKLQHLGGVDVLLEQGLLSTGLSQAELSLALFALGLG